MAKRSRLTTNRASVSRRTWSSSTLCQHHARKISDDHTRPSPAPTTPPLPCLDIEMSRLIYWTWYNSFSSI